MAETLHEQVDVSIVTETTGDEEVVTISREFDTDKPVDPATGTPPLKRETTQTRRKVETEHQTQTAGQIVDLQRDVVEQHRDNATVQIEATEKRGLNDAQRTLCIIGSLALLVGIAWLVWKLKR